MNDPMVDAADRYMEQQEWLALGEFVNEVLQELVNTGSFWIGGSDCFPDGAFTLDKYDYICSGIKLNEITFEKDGMRIIVHAHTTIYPSITDELTDMVQEMVMGSGYAGEWTCGDWTMWFEEDIVVSDWEREVKVIARYILIKANRAINDFRNEMDYITKIQEQMEDVEVESAHYWSRQE